MFGEKLIAQLGLNSEEFAKKIGDSTKLVGVFDGVLGQIGLGLGAGAVIGFFGSIIEKGGQLQDVSEQLGITTDSLQAFDYQAKQAGVSSEQLGAAYNKLTVAGGEASDATSAASKALAKLGIDSKAFQDAAIDVRMEMIAKASAEATNKQEAFSAVSDLLGSKVAPRLQSMMKQLAEEGLGGFIAKAKEAGQVIESDTIRQMDDLGDRVSALKNRVQTFGAGILQGVFTFAEGLGEQMARVANTVQGITTDTSALEASHRKVELAVEKVNVALLGTKATTEDIKKLDEAREKLSEKSMSYYELESLYLAKIVKLANEKGKYASDSKEALAIETEMLGLQAKLKDQINTAQKKANDEQKRFEDASRLGKEDLLKLFILEQKGVENLTQLERARYDLLKLQAQKKQEQVFIDDLLKDGIGALSEDEESMLRLLIKNTAETDKQIAKKSELVTGIERSTSAEEERLNVQEDETAEIEKQNALLAEQNRVVSTIRRTGKDYTQQSTESLNYVADNLTKQQSAAQYEKFVYGYSPALYAVQSELDQVMKELRARSDFQNALQMGDAFAKRIYAPDEYERLSKFIVPQGDTKRAADTLDSIEARLKALFPKT